MGHFKSYEGNTSIKNDILSALAYFDIFDYPLKRREISLFVPNIYTELQIQDALDGLLASSRIFKLGEFFSLRDNYELEERRKKGNEKANGMLATAEKVGYLLSKFPYVRGVAISGSLSKNFADENSDIDLFIITAKNRLWIARSLHHVLFKLACLINRQHLFCMNYYIDEDALEIQEKNIYTATEIVTLIPLQGSIVFREFLLCNAWTNNAFPNNYMSVSTAKTLKFHWYKWIIEKLLNNAIGNSIDTLLMNITSKRWRLKTKRNFLNKNGLLFSMMTGKHYAKHDPATFQDKIVLLHKQKMYDLLKSADVKKAAIN